MKNCYIKSYPHKGTGQCNVMQCMLILTLNDATETTFVTVTATSNDSSISASYTVYQMWRQQIWCLAMCVTISG